MFNIKFLLMAIAIFNGSLQISNLIFDFTDAVEKGESQTYPNCTVKWSNALPSWYPLVFNGSGIIYPRKTGNNSDWSLVIKRFSNIKLGCPADGRKSNNVQGYEGRNEIVVRCLSRGLTVDREVVNFTQLGCVNPVKEKVVTTGNTCFNDSTVVDILFQSNSTLLPLINVCHDTKTDDTHYSHHFIIGQGLNPYEVSNARPSFKEGQFYTQISANDAYTQNSQLNQVALLVGSQALAEKYINSSKSFYLARGHIAPDGDFVHIYQQNATYYFINVMPQWQAINNGNWKALETGLRNYSKDQNVDLEVWTGGKDVLKLDDVNGNPVEIYLARDKQGNLRLPAPELTWKVVKDPVRNASVSVFTINNPHLTQIPSRLKICPEVNAQISWLNWDTQNIERGYTYFCRVSDVKNALPLPGPLLNNLASLKLMT